MHEDFYRQTRRFFAGFLTDSKEKQRRLLAKRPCRRCAMRMKMTSYHLLAKIPSAPVSMAWRTGDFVLPATQNAGIPALPVFLRGVMSCSILWYSIIKISYYFIYSLM